jgi:DNA-binding NarL/FixJ family response regulator
MFDAHCANLHLKGSSRFAEKRRTEKRLSKKLKNYAPELIGMDLSMPVMNGLDAARLIHHLLPRVPIIMFSECAGAFTQQQASAVGIAALVSKSMSPH